jgi:outer membrane receptor for ferrienterochelin and colicin
MPFGMISQHDSVAVKKDSVDYYDMSLEQLLKLKAHGVPSELEKLINSLISVASKKPLNVRESPSILSLITADEIKASGARDLIDVLRLVPGFDFGVDVEGVVGLGVRGNWAHEGKVLVLLDGQEMNEILYGTTQFGNHFPIDLIKKIEIIRGPGSAIYGGYAEYGVINIITKQGSDINGVAVSSTYGTTASSAMRSNVNLSTGSKKGDFEWSLSGMIGKGQRSDQTYTDVFGSSYKMAGNSALNPAFANLGISYKGLSFRGIGDFYHMNIQDGNTNIMTRSLPQNFNSMYFELKYACKINEKLTITPKLNYKNQSPWLTPTADTLNGQTINSAYNKVATRSTANVIASYNVTRNVNFVAGGETYMDNAKDNLALDSFYNHKKSVSFYNYAFFTQGLVKTRLVNIILGARYDKHNVYGDAFVPRVGLTKKYKYFHFKALYSNSFRAPSIENINYSTATGILPERTQVGELELGYQVTRKSIFTVNLYDITTKNPIVYLFNSTTYTDEYINHSSTGTRGVEAEYRIKANWGSAGVNYSFYTAQGKTKTSTYEIPNQSSLLLGFTNQRANLFATVIIAKKLSINVTASYYGSRWGSSSFNSADSTSTFKKFDPVMLINTFINYTTPLKGLTIGGGVYDLLDQRFVFIQPYTNIQQPGHAPLPGPPREFVFKFQYILNYKTKTSN